MLMLVSGESKKVRDNSMSSNTRRSIGTYNWDATVELEYPEAFQKALLKVLDGKKTFNYVYLGGAFTVTDQEKSLWFLSKGRHLRVRPYSFPCNAFCCSLSDIILTIIRDLPRRNSWNLESRTRM